MRRSLHSVLTAAFTTAALSCTLPNAGTDAGAVDAGAQTVGDQCSTIAVAFCDRGIGGCSVLDTLSNCVDTQMLNCCVGSTCAAPSGSARSALNACTSAIASEDCNSVVTVGWSGLAACQGIPRRL